ncbi:MAG TPA: hypothetical protein VF831_04995 [Anaerolineales bacterium]
MQKFSSIVVGSYTWIVTVFFGAILLDILYFRSMQALPGIAESSVVFSEVSDTLLLLGFVVIFVALIAIASSWKFRNARSLFIASLLMIILEFITPIFISWINQDTQDLSIGPWLRITLGGLASMLAFMGSSATIQQK